MPGSEVKESTVILNKWFKMNVSDAKRAFLLKTLMEMLEHLYEQLGGGKTKQENAGGNFWTPTAKFDHGGSHHGL